MPAEPLLVTESAEVAALVGTIGGARRVALDAEGNGLFAYRSRLCTLQIGWESEDGVRVAIVDTLRIDPSLLAGLLGSSGPIKLLHDCTFDVKLLSESNVTLAGVRDTSVTARMLGRKATGLASLLAAELGITLQKELQQHDWSRRPFEPREIEYLADDVRYLMALDDKLAVEARALDIEEEVEVECLFKVEGALAPPRERRPAYLRIRGAEKLDRPGLSVLRRLVEVREGVAAEWDQPPFKVASNDWLLSIAATKPPSVRELRRLRGSFSPRFLAHAEALVDAVRMGLADEETPIVTGEVRLDKAVLAARRSREKRLTAWRRKEAAARGVDEQVVLPGHCLQEIAALDGGEVDAIAQVAGLGGKRLSRYGAALATLVMDPVPEPQAPAQESQGQ
jgi:ribonuclease D